MNFFHLIITIGKHIRQNYLYYIVSVINTIWAPLNICLHGYPKLAISGEFLFKIDINAPDSLKAIHTAQDVQMH